jgi:anti-sigma regulatory factor (Ser/Thr protein kinase)
MEPSSSAQQSRSVEYQLRLKNRLENLEILSAWVSQLANQLNLSAKCTFRLDLVLSEAVTNVIENAYEDGAEHEIEVILQYDEPLVRVQVCDDGLPFDPTQNAAVELPKKLEDATEGGLGIHLMRSYTKEFTYQRQGDRNLLTMVLHNPG